jgi:hypothetical protein
LREISPADNCGVDEYLRLAPSEARTLALEIRRRKETGRRPCPSSSLIDNSTTLTAPTRARILDAVAKLVDENLFGRSDMCKQFADLLCLGLVHLGVEAKTVSGTAIYFSDARKEIFRWDHAWVRIGREIIDGNIDSVHENPMVPSAVRVAPYWGPVEGVPRDRKLRAHIGTKPAPPDEDVLKLWWPELRDVLPDISKG